MITANVQCKCQGWAGVLVTAVMLCGSVVRADEAAERKAAELLDKYVEATGGQAAYDAVKTRILKADVSVPAVGMTAKMELYAALPDKFYTVLQTPAGNMERGWNGKVVWMSLPGMGPRILEGAEKVAVIRDSTQDRFAQWRKLFTKAEYAGEEEVGGKKYQKVVLTPKPLEEAVQESPITVLIDPETGLIRQYTAEVVTPQGATEVVVLLDAYKAVGGIKVPHEMAVEVQGIKQTVRINEMKVNAPIAAEKLALPPAVQEAIKQLP